MTPTSLKPSFLTDLNLLMKTTEILYAVFSLYSLKYKAIFPFRDDFNLDQYINYSLYSNILCRTKHSAINCVTKEYVRYLNFELKFKLTIKLSPILTFIVENHSRQGKNPSCICSKVLQSAIDVNIALCTRWNMKPYKLCRIRYVVMKAPWVAPSSKYNMQIK